MDELAFPNINGWRPRKFFAVVKFQKHDVTIRRWFENAGLRRRRIGGRDYYQEEDVAHWVETGCAPPHQKRSGGSVR